MDQLGMSSHSEQQLDAIASLAHLFRGRAVWSTIPFGEVTRQLRGVRCRTIPLQLPRGRTSPQHAGTPTTQPRTTRTTRRCHGFEAVGS
jgi:hypothetical protein